MNVLLLGANGFIGSQVAIDLAAAGHRVTGLVRHRPQTPSASLADHAVADMARLLSPQDWKPLLAGIDTVVNCAGALQSGAHDNVAAVQRDAMLALYRACTGEGIKLFVQVSAPLEGAGAGTEFLATKREADAALATSGLPFVILRPALVLGRNAFGGSALIRALAAFPFVLPLAYPETPVRLVALEDVSGAVVEAVQGAIAPGSDITLAHERSYSLTEVVALHRAWLGLGEARVLAMPDPVAGVASAIADGLGLLGWRSPMRSTAMLVAGGGIATASTGELRATPTGLEALLARNPAGAQDLWFARLYMLKPVLFAVLSLFWIVSGLVALVGFDRAVASALANGFPATGATIMVAVTALADIAIGAGIAIRKFSRGALLASIALALAYLAAATWFSPALWLEPLGPLVKVVPAIALSLAALAILEERA